MQPILSHPQPQSLQPLGEAALEKVLVEGRLEHLSPKERLLYYKSLCETLGLNPLTRPFEYLVLDGKLTLYARRDATDQLRRLHKISITIVSRERLDDIYVVTARATTPDGRTDEAIGAVSLLKKEMVWDAEQYNSKTGKKGTYVWSGKMIPLVADELANAIMRAETKAKRRVALSIVGLGILDESELDTVPQAQRVTIDDAAAEVVEPQQLEPSQSQPSNNTTPTETVTQEPPTEPTFGDAYEEEIDQVMLDECNQLYERFSDERKVKFVNWLHKQYGKAELIELNNDELIEVYRTLTKATRTTTGVQQ
jgi:hypothetical protein